MAATALCYAGCGTAWAACYAAAGLVAGTITAGIGVPAAALACNAAEGTCMGYCIGVAAAEAPVTGGLSLLGALASCAAEKGSGEDADKSLNDLMREIAAVEMQGLKMKAVCDSNSFEQKRYQEKQEALQAEITQAHADIEQKKEELEEARVYKQHMAEAPLTLKLRKRNRPCPATDSIHRQGRSQI
eukprot:gene27990-32418_t